MIFKFKYQDRRAARTAAAVSLTYAAFVLLCWLAMDRLTPAWQLMIVFMEIVSSVAVIGFFIRRTAHRNNKGALAGKAALRPEILEIHLQAEHYEIPLAEITAIRYRRVGLTHYGLLMIRTDARSYKIARATGDNQALARFHQALAAHYEKFKGRDPQ